MLWILTCVYATQITAKRVTKDVEACKLFTFERLEILGKGGPPFFKIISEIVNAFLRSKFCRKISSSTTTSHSYYIKGYLIKICTQILKYLEIKRCRCSISMVVYDCLPSINPLTRYYCPYYNGSTICLNAHF